MKSGRKKTTSGAGKGEGVQERGEGREKELRDYEKDEPGST